MKVFRVLILMFFAASLFMSCSNEEEATPLAADFEISVTGEAPNATITITNKSTGATAYQWQFGEGASIETSTDENPNITVEKAGDFTITLVASAGTEEKTKTETVTISGNHPIITYTDVEFALNAGDATYGRLFSTETGLIYRDDELTDIIGPKIDIAFGSMGNTMYYFESPDVADYSVPGATHSKITNQTTAISITEFDAMQDDALLETLTISADNESFGNSSIPNVVLFENAAGKKGAIKTKAVNSDRLLVDIKIQKY